ncbi:MAG: hypothetical protein MUP09_10560, partial [Thiovulaceae bacterium]|nr:hypothetical protein [Sulfurimonadaceae bacterium]
VEIIPLIDVNITSNDVNIDSNNTADVYTASVYPLKANGTFGVDGATIMDISSNINIKWASSNTTIATVDSAGLLTVFSTVGMVDVNVSVYNEINSTVELNVTNQ